MKTKFKEGDEIFFITGGFAAKSKIVGITTHCGKRFDANGTTIHWVAPATIYHTELAVDVDERHAFSTANLLICNLSEQQKNDKKRIADQLSKL